MSSWLKRLLHLFSNNKLEEEISAAFEWLYRDVPRGRARTSPTPRDRDRDKKL